MIETINENKLSLPIICGSVTYDKKPTLGLVLLDLILVCVIIVCFIIIEFELEEVLDVREILYPLLFQPYLAPLKTTLLLP